MKFIKIFSLAFIMALSCTPDANSQIFKKKPKKSEKADNGDTKKKMKPYNKVITKDAITQNGLVSVHQVDDDW